MSWLPRFHKPGASPGRDQRPKATVLSGVQGMIEVMAMDNETLQRMRAALSCVEADARYYALTLTADEEGRITWSAQSSWVGGGTKATWELRAPRPVHPGKMLALWKSIGQSGIVVGDRETFGIFLRVGGNAIVEQGLARQLIPDVLEPVECVPGPVLGLRLLDTIPKANLDHAPSKKMRMDVLRRDNFRCRICGRRAADEVDIVLHVHHIRPHGMGGLTETRNLITLCHTCHIGLDPHLELGLYSMLPRGLPLGGLDRNNEHYMEGVRRYRQVSARLVQVANGAEPAGGETSRRNTELHSVPPGQRVLS